MIQVSEEEKGSWTFAGLQSSTAGVRVEEFGKPTGERASWLRSHGRKFAAAMAYPFRRTLQRPWGTVVVRYGSTGNEEAFLDRGDETYTDHRESRVRPPRDGELFVYLNKPLLAFRPNWLDNINSGTAKITVTRIEQIRAR
jgi:hypothetical protein